MRPFCIFEDNKIRRFGKVIGTKRDIKFGRKIKDIKPKMDAFANMFSDESWPFNRSF